MTLSNELASWKSKQAEAERELKKCGDDITCQRKWSSMSYSAGTEINRIENVLRARPSTDDLEAEEMRHFKAKENISKSWENRTHPAVQ